MRFACVLTTLAVPSLASAGSFHRFDLPGASLTCGTAIASSGLVAGFGTGGSLAHPAPFLRRGTHITVPALNLPSGITILGGINAKDTFVGSDLYGLNGGITVFIGHGATITATPDFEALAAVNDSGTVLGQISAPKQPLTIYNVGVMQTKAGTQTILDDGTGGTNPAGMDETATHVVGTSIGTRGLTAWRWDQGTFTPIAFPGATATFPNAVTTAGIVYGSYAVGTASTAVSHGFVLGPFGYRTWDAPRAVATEINDANAAGEITGCYTDKAGVTHGYIAMP